MALGQKDAVYGYSRAGDALGHVFNPDQTDLAIFLRYAVPLMDTYEAAAIRARATERQTTDRLKETRNRLLRRMDEALARISHPTRILGE